MQTTTQTGVTLPSDIEYWLNEHVCAAYDALSDDPSRALTADQVRARLAAEHAKAR